MPRARPIRARTIWTKSLNAGACWMRTRTFSPTESSAILTRAESSSGMSPFFTTPKSISSTSQRVHRRDVQLSLVDRGDQPDVNFRRVRLHLREDVGVGLLPRIDAGDRLQRLYRRQEAGAPRAPLLLIAQYELLRRDLAGFGIDVQPVGICGWRVGTIVGRWRRRGRRRGRRRWRGRRRRRRRWRWRWHGRGRRR